MKIFLIASIIFILTSMIVGQEQRPSGKLLNAEDFAKGQIDRRLARGSLALEIQINPRLQPYKFNIVPDLAISESPESDYRSHHVGWIEISVGESSSMLQKIDVRTRAAVPWLTGSFWAEDVNFDGFLDIAVYYDFGAKWISPNYWLYDKRTGRFITSPLTRELKRITFSRMDLDNKTKAIRFVSYIGTCPQNETYKIMNQHLVLVEREESVCTLKGQKILVTTFVKKRINGRMKLVRTERTT